jgi:surfeit locus 1 family protein
MAVPASQVGLSAAGKAFFGGLCAGTFGLGCWQSKRLLEKQELVASRQTDLAMEPSNKLTASAFTSDDTQKSFRRVLLTGTFQHDRQVLVGPRGPPAGALPDGPGTSAAGMSQAPQGYFIITPLTLDADKSTDASAASTSTVLVNRGWIPRHMAPPSEHEVQLQERRQQHEVMKQQQQGVDAPLQKQLAQQYQQQQVKQQRIQWDQPAGTVHVTVVAAKGEQPRFMVPEHELASTPPKFFWFDLTTMRQHLQQTMTDNSDNGSNGNGSSNMVAMAKDENAKLVSVDASSTDSSDSATNDVPFVTAVSGSDMNHGKALQDIVWPVTPTADKVADFKVSPTVHAGYAFTWFGLSGAGLYMTRMLLMRGRK